jgi:tetraacyldisaccharide 4'-kinase
VAIEHPLPDHYRYAGAELASAGDAWVVMTEKDAVKCRRLSTADATRDWYYLEVEASFAPADAARIANVVHAATPPHSEQLA